MAPEIPNSQGRPVRIPLTREETGGGSSGSISSSEDPIRSRPLFHMRRIGWIVGRAVSSQKAARDPVARSALEKLGEDLLAWVDEFPQSFRRGASPLAFTPNLEEFLAVAIENNRYGPYWVRKGGLNTKDFWDSYADVPVLWQGGWYDIMPKQTTEQYVRTARKNRSPQRLLMGPWTHGDPRSYSGDAEFGQEAAVDFDIIGLRSFDQFVKGVDTGLMEEPPVRIFVMGTGGHRHRRRREGAGRLSAEPGLAGRLRDEPE